MVRAATAGHDRRLRYVLERAHDLEAGTDRT
jgi:hypothetical protein